MKKERSFFKKITGALSPEEEGDTLLYEEHEERRPWAEESPSEGELTVDVYETPHHIIIKTIIAGVKREDLDIVLSRDMVTVKGRREAETAVEDSDYFHKELYWGTFSRTILLPQEVDIEKAEALEDRGLLTIKLPKVDKEKQTKLRVKAA